eukprot:gene9204-19084_t
MEHNGHHHHEDRPPLEHKVHHHEDHHHSKHDIHHHVDHPHTNLDAHVDEDSWKIWFNALLTTFVISFIPTVILVLIPSSWLLSSPVGKIKVQHIFLAFAAGGLLGDVFIHALPHLLSKDQHSHGHHIEECLLGQDQNNAHDNHCSLASQGDSHGHGHGHGHNHFDSGLVGVQVLLGFIIFFIAEKIVSRHVHSHNNIDNDTDSNSTTTTTTSTSTSKQQLSQSKDGSESHSSPITHTHNHNHTTITNSPDMKSSLGASGWLNLVADLMHNFTDGLAIGTSFASGKSLALATGLSVFFHEIPHEVGDVSILIQSGFTKKQAIFAQFGTAIAAFLGTVVGLLSQRHEALEQWLLALTCGGFVYIATVGVMPVIMQGHSSWLQIALETVSFCLGVAIMVGVAVLEGME